MATTIKVKRSAAARASVSSGVYSTGIDIDPVEQARKLQFMHKLGMGLLAALFILLNVALLLVDPPMALVGAAISALAYAIVLFFARLALAHSLSALMTWHYTERTAAAAATQSKLLQALLERLTVEP